MGADGALPHAEGPPLSLGPTPARKDVFRLRDFWATPGTGTRGKARWQQTMGAMVLRLVLKGAPWQNLSEEEFQVRLCEYGLRVSNKHRPEASDAFLKDSLNGDFPHEVLVRSSWWCVEANEEDPMNGEVTMVVHLVKAKDKSWQQPFNEGPLARSADLASDWVALTPGRRADVSDDAKLGIRPAELLQELTVAQTDDLVTLRLLLHQAKLDEAKRQVPMSRLWGLDLTEESIRVFLRGAEGTPLLAGALGGRIDPGKTDWSMMKVTREREDGADGAGARETRPALSIQLRKAEGARHEWKEVLAAGAQPAPAGEAAIGALDEDGEQARLLELEGAGDGVDREGWTAAEHARELKARGDDFFKKRSWDQAVEYYTRALGHTPNDEKLLSNRSAAFMEVKSYQQALDDAQRCEEIAPRWPKAFYRQGVALKALRRYDMAVSVLSEGKARDPGNPNWQREMDDAEEKKAARQAARARAGAR
mmetsp:Transcript_23418/g.65544  ORF Transcript_23418/g.65544 Transcript_23418/m.65544 type:complete len:479 (+) Transcript_23418:45-1481(+)